MSLPPLNLLLPHIHTFTDNLTAYPLHITSTSPAPLLVLLLLHHASHRSVPGPPSVLIHCGTAEEFLSDLRESQCAHAAFFRSDVSGKGKFLYASRMVRMIHVTTLHELRSLLYVIQTSGIVRASNDDAGEHSPTSVPDSQASAEREEDTLVPLLSISKMDSLHRDAGELTSQGMARTLASALDAAYGKYNVVIHGCIPLDEEIRVLNEQAHLPEQFAYATTTLERFYSRYITCNWDTMQAKGNSEGIWRYLNGRGGYKVIWQQDNHGECISSSLARLPQENAS